MNRSPLSAFRRLTSKILFAAAFFSLACVVPAQAAEISLPVTGEFDRPLGGVLIEGPIVKGDFKRFQYLALSTSGSGAVWLASPGGDLAEAMKIGQLVRRLKMEVWAPDSNRKLWSSMIKVADPRNNVCASACFFIYAAGTYRTGGVLGVHRPRFAEEDLKAMTLEQAANGHASVGEIAAAYLRKMGIPNSIIEKAATTKPNDIQWLTEGEVKSLSGYIPEFEDWIEAKCSETWRNVPDDPKPCKDCSANELLARWNVRAAEQKSSCKSNLTSEAKAKARRELLDEYVKDGRIQELISEQKLACSTPTAKNRRECPASMAK